MSGIAVLCPSRQRRNALTESVASLRHTAHHWDRVQVVVRIDTDDPQHDDYLALDGVDNTTVLVGDPHGYRGLWRYYNDCAAATNADWLLMWNDDVLMRTRHWDDRIAEHTGRFVCLGPHTEPHGQAFTIIPAVPRTWYQVVGHLSLNSQADFWLMDIAKELGIYEWIDVHTLHNRADITGANCDATYAARNYDSERYYSPEQAAERAVDTARLKAWLRR